MHLGLCDGAEHAFITLQTLYHQLVVVALTCCEIEAGQREKLLQEHKDLVMSKALSKALDEHNTNLGVDEDEVGLNLAAGQGGVGGVHSSTL